MSERAVDEQGLPVRKAAHILLITVDALRADRLGLHGYERGVTPGIDAWGAQAVVFERAYAQAPHSSWSLCSLMTGEYLHETTRVDPAVPEATLASVLGRSGYRTAAFFTEGIFYTDGAALTAYRESGLGFASRDHDNPAADERTTRVLATVDRIVADGEPPSFLWVHYFDPHEPYLDTSLGAGIADRYDAEVRNADRGVSRLIAKARKRLSRDVIVVLTADHGEELRDHGGISHGSTLYDEQVRVPLIIDVPGLAPRRVDGPVELVDVAPSLLALVGAEVPESMRGDDLRPELVRDDVPSRPAFSAVAHQRMVVLDGYKLVANLPAGIHELYDLSADPRERVNRAADHDASRLVGALHAWHDAVRGPEDDPLALGRLHDDRAIDPLIALIGDETAPTERRVEAASLLGTLGADRAIDPLSRATREDGAVGVQAAISLATLRSPRAIPKLLAALESEEPSDLRPRVAIAAGRLALKPAVPALIEILESGAPYEDKRDALGALYRLRDPRALDALLAITEDSQLQYRAITAIGLTESERAFAPLAQMLAEPRRTMVRDGLARALGLLGDARAVPILAELAAAEPELIYATESLVRLAATRTDAVGGTDVGPRTQGLRGFRNCHRGDPYDLTYRWNTWCETRATEARIPLAPLTAPRDRPVVLVLSARALDAAATEITLSIGERAIPLTLTDRWAEHRIAWAGEAPTEARLSAASPIAVDHLLILAAPPPRDARAPSR